MAGEGSRVPTTDRMQGNQVILNLFLPCVEKNDSKQIHISFIKSVIVLLFVHVKPMSQLTPMAHNDMTIQSRPEMIKIGANGSPVLVSIATANGAGQLT